LLVGDSSGTLIQGKDHPGVDVSQCEAEVVPAHHSEQIARGMAPPEYV